MNRSSETTLSAPPRFLLWLVLLVFFLLIVAAMGGVNYFRSGQRLGAFIPFAMIAFGGFILFVIGGAVAFRRTLPRLLWLWVSTLSLLLVAGVAVGGVFAYRSLLPPRYQEQMLTEMPFMRAFLPPTPSGGMLPTVQPAEGGISPDDLLSLALPTEEAEVTEAVTEAPTEEATVEAVVALPTETPTPSPTPTLPSTEAPTVAAAQPAPAPAEITTAQQVSSISRPSAARMYGFTYVRQGWNNCGPANITMALSYYGWRESQAYAAEFLKPVEEDKNVSPSEMVNFVRTNTQLNAVSRMGGDMELIKDLVAANIPVIIEAGYWLEGENWLGHYLTVVAYDDAQSGFYVYDSWLGAGAGTDGMLERYSDFDARWQEFNRTFIVIYEKDREDVVQQILGERADLQKSYEQALEVATAEANANRQNGFAWFNMGTSYTRLGDYERAAAAYDRAFQLNLPFRFLWYQFGPFEAYYNAGRYDEVLALVQNNLNSAGNYVEESFYWQGMVYAAQGRRSEATAAFQRAIAQNPNYAAAQQALNEL